MARRVCGISRVDSTWPALAEVHLWPTSFIMTTIRPLLRDPSTSVGIALATSTVRYESSTQQHPGIRGLLSFGSICLARPLLSPAELRFALGGWCADMRSPFLENKMKRQDSHAHASNTMRPASAALGQDHTSAVLRERACVPCLKFSLIFHSCSAWFSVEDGGIKRAAAGREQHLYITISLGCPGDSASPWRDA